VLEVEQPGEMTMPQSKQQKLVEAVGKARQALDELRSNGVATLHDTAKNNSVVNDSVVVINKHASELESALTEIASAAGAQDSSV